MEPEMKRKKKENKDLTSMAEEVEEEEEEEENDEEEESSPLRSTSSRATKPLSSFPPKSPQLQPIPSLQNPPTSSYVTGKRKPFSPPLKLQENSPNQVRLQPEQKKPFSESPEISSNPMKFHPSEQKKVFSLPPPRPPESPSPDTPPSLHEEKKNPFSPPAQSPAPLPSQPPPSEKPQSKAMVSVGCSPLRSPTEQQKYHTPQDAVAIPNPSSPPAVVVNRSMREEISTKIDNGEDGLAGNRHREDIENGTDRRKPKVLSSVLRRESKLERVKKAALGFRICALVFCLISFSVMAADRTQGWAGDSFERYKEYRYCFSVNIIGFVYAGFQAYDLAYGLATEKHVIPRNFGYYFDFFMDQIMTYLLISASSSAATRVDDWVTNWGKDEFTKMASASISMSFMAFFAFAFSSLISGYNLCTRDSYN